MPHRAKHQTPNPMSKHAPGHNGEQQDYKNYELMKIPHAALQQVKYVSSVTHLVKFDNSERDKMRPIFRGGNHIQDNQNSTHCKLQTMCDP